jgi:hypothetical protein
MRLLAIVVAAAGASGCSTDGGNRAKALTATPRRARITAITVTIIPRLRSTAGGRAALARWLSGRLARRLVLAMVGARRGRWIAHVDHEASAVLIQQRPTKIAVAPFGVATPVVPGFLSSAWQDG